MSASISTSARVWRLCLTALLLFVVSGANAQDFYSGGLYYNILSSSDKTCEVTNNNGWVDCYSGSVTIPETVTYNGTTYTVTGIDDKTFYMCSSLTSVTIGNSVTKIGKNAFGYCSKLTEITIGEGVMQIGSGAFECCFGLKQVNFNAIACSSVSSQPTGCFANSSKLSIINFGDKVTIIASYLCGYCTGLTEVTIPESVTSIGTSAFQECTGLTRIITLNPEPPACSTYTNAYPVFYNVPTSCILYVPVGSKEAYSTAYAWEDFMNIVELTSDVIEPTVQTYEATEISYGSALLRGIAAAGLAEITEQGFEYWTEDGNVQTIEAEGEEMSVTLTGLTPETTYYYKAYATTALGTIYGEEEAFTTTTFIPISVVTNKATDITATTATLHGSVTTGSDAIKEQGFEYWASGGKVQTATATGEEMSVTLTGLEDGVTYTYRAYAKTVSGTTYGEEMTFTTIKAPTVQTYAATEITYNSALFAGLVTVGEEKVLEQGFEYWCADGDVMTVMCTGGEMSVTITGLKQDTKYTYRAYARTESGTAYGAEMTFATAPVDPPTVQTYEATEVTTNSALLRGTVEADEEKIQEQGFEYWADGEDVQTVTSPDQFMAVTLTGLEDGVTYTYRAYAITANYTVYGEEMTFTTIKAPTVQTYEVTEITENSALLKGSITAGNEDVLGQGFEYWAAGGEVQTIAMADQMMAATITGLNEGTTYTCRAYAKTASGTTYGEEVTFTTLGTAAVTPPTVQTYEATEVTESSATLNGVVAAGSEKVTEQGFEYWSSSGDVQTVVSTSSGLSVMVSNLTSSTTYTYRAYAKTASGTTYGEEVTFITLAATITPPTVQTYAATEVTESSATLNGVVAAGSEKVTEQGFEYWSSSGDVQTVVSTSSSLSVTVSNLTSSTKYTCRAYAKTASGTTYGEEVTFTTLVDTSGIDDITTNGNAEVVGYYTMDGKQVSTLQRGINIIRYGDGTARKVRVK